MRRRRWRTAVLWVGCTLCVLIAAAFVVSGRWSINYQIPDTLRVQIFSGHLVIGNTHYRVPDHLFYHRHFLGWREWNLWRWGSHYYRFPFWFLFFVAAIPTDLVQRFVPKFPRGHCRRCGYNLTGLTEARCPECGQPFERMTRAAPPLVRGSSRPIR